MCVLVLCVYCQKLNKTNMTAVCFTRKHYFSLSASNFTFNSMLFSIFSKPFMSENCFYITLLKYRIYFVIICEIISDF